VKDSDQSAAVYGRSIPGPSDGNPPKQGTIEREIRIEKTITMKRKIRITMGTTTETSIQITRKKRIKT
jgi:hypothetical protein